MVRGVGQMGGRPDGRSAGRSGGRLVGWMGGRAADRPVGLTGGRISAKFGRIPAKLGQISADFGQHRPDLANMGQLHLANFGWILGRGRMGDWARGRRGRSRARWQDSWVRAFSSECWLKVPTMPSRHIASFFANV